MKALGGTVGEVTTDYSGSGYEVTVTKADGSQVEVHLDSSFNVMQRPGGFGGWRGAHPERARGSRRAPVAPGRIRP